MRDYIARVCYKGNYKGERTPLLKVKQRHRRGGTRAYTREISLRRDNILVSQTRRYGSPPMIS